MKMGYRALYTGALQTEGDGLYSYIVFKNGKPYTRSEKFKPIVSPSGRGRPIHSKGLAEESLRSFLKHLNKQESQI